MHVKKNQILLVNAHLIYCTIRGVIKQGQKYIISISKRKKIKLSFFIFQKKIIKMEKKVIICEAFEKRCCAMHFL